MKRQPKQDTTAFRVFAVQIASGRDGFRRSGIEFTREPQVIERSKLTQEQVVELLNTPSLHVEELAGERSGKPERVKPEETAEFRRPKG